MNALTNGFTISNGTISKHSLTDYGLAISNTDYIGDPEMESYTVDVPGRAGLLDLSTALTGYPVFKDRTIKIEVGGVGTPSGWDATISDFRNNFEGQMCTITFDNDSTWYWKGRVYVTKFKRTRGLATFTIKMEADAYKYKVTPVVDTYTMSSETKTVTIRSYTNPVVPYFYCSSGTLTLTCTITGQSVPLTYTLSAGHGMSIPGLNSRTDNMTITAGTTGTLTVTWEEMSL